MGEVNAVVEYCRFSKDQIIDAYFVILFSIFAAIKPSEIADGCAVGEVGYHAFLARSHGEGFEAHDAAYHLHERHVPREFVDGIDLRAVYIFVWIVFKQVTISLNAEFITQHLFTVRSHAGKKLNVL